MREIALALVAAIVGFGVIQGVFQLQAAAPSFAAMPVAAASSASCVIKGNISLDDGDYIYHVPGQRYYAQTIIRPEYGERWFCSEAEAQAAGWRKSRI
ncbi:MAG: hypothetical protein ABL866_07710 [Devosia sp.]